MVMAEETGEFKRQSREFAQALVAAGCPPPTCVEVPQRNHFDVILDLARSGTALGEATQSLLQLAHPQGDPIP